MGSITIFNFISLYFVAGNVFTYKRSFINLFLLPKVYASNIILEFLLPVIPFIFLFSKRSDIEIGRAKDYLSAAFCAPIMFGSAYLLELFVYCIIDPSIKSLAFSPTGLFSSVLESNPVGYIFLYIMHVCAWGYVLTLFGLAVRYRTNSQYYAVVTAFLLSRLSSYIPIVFVNIKVPVLGYLIPQLPFETAQMEDSWFSDFTQLLFVFAISIILIKNKETCKCREEVSL